jgi:hypothetical protein
MAIETEHYAEQGDRRAVERVRLSLMTSQMKRPQTSDHHAIRELLIHAVAFLLAAAVGAVILWHYYWFLEWNTDDAAGAHDAFLASVGIVGGFGPVITMLFFWLRRMIGAGHDPGL